MFFCFQPTIALTFWQPCSMLGSLWVIFIHGATESCFFHPKWDTFRSKRLLFILSKFHLVVFYQSLELEAIFHLHLPSLFMTYQQHSWESLLPCSQTSHTWLRVFLKSCSKSHPLTTFLWFLKKNGIAGDSSFWEKKPNTPSPQRALCYVF